MPAKSKAQQEAMAIAEHNPSQLYPNNRGLLKMTQEQLHDFAATPRKGLPKRVKKPKPEPTAFAYDWKQHQGQQREE